MNSEKLFAQNRHLDSRFDPTKLQNVDKVWIEKINAYNEFFV